MQFIDFYDSENCKQTKNPNSEIEKLKNQTFYQKQRQKRRFLGVEFANVPLEEEIVLWKIDEQQTQVLF